jgi:phospholipid/cholesterol/gamma-HCH transport system ATP-binding protein
VNIEKVAFKLNPSEISGGMQKRVAIARAIALNPKYLFCDEPNSGLDPETATVIDKLIQDLTKEFQMTTIINTHDMNSVIEIGESILFISKGEKEWIGTKKEVLRSGSKKLNDFIFANKLYAQMKRV